MFMRVNSKCAHQVRPPLQSSRPCSTLGTPLLPPARHRDALTFYICLSQLSRRVEKTDLLQGTFDQLILQITTPGPVHGYAISQRLNQISREARENTECKKAA